MHNEFKYREQSTHLLVIYLLDSNSGREMNDNYTIAANGRNDGVTLFTLYLPPTVFSFSVKLISFAFESKVRISL